jgi:hypothetical protein
VARYALVRQVDGLVLNVAEWDGLSPWTPPTGTVVIQSDLAQTGGTWDGTTFSAPPPPPPDPLIPDIATVRAYYTDAGLTAALGVADGSFTAAQRDYAIKNGIRGLRALIRIVRGLAAQ